MRHRQDELALGAPEPFERRGDLETEFTVEGSAQLRRKLGVPNSERNCGVIASSKTCLVRIHAVSPGRLVGHYNRPLARTSARPASAHRGASTSALA
jgi:hypothetical protein